MAGRTGRFGWSSAFRIVSCVPLWNQLECPSNKCCILFHVFQIGTVNGDKLKHYRESKNLSQRDLGDMLDVSGPTVNRWESGEQDIPGPAGLLLDWLIDGIPPFGAEGAGAAQLEAAAWKVEMTLEQFEKLQAKALAVGFSEVVDYIGWLVASDLRAGAQTEREMIGLLAEDTQGAKVPSPMPVRVYQKPGRGKRK